MKPKNSEIMVKNTADFLDNERINCAILHEKNINMDKSTLYESIHKGKEIVKTIEYFKKTLNSFIENEKIFSEITHENNVGKIKYKLNILLDDESSPNTQECSMSKSNGHLESISQSEHSIIDQIENSRVLQDLSKEKTTTNDNKSETSILTKSRFDYSGSAPKRYTTSCYIKPTPVPIWYTESLTLKINSTKRTYREQVYFKVKQRPYKWSETMTTEVMTCPKLHQNEAVVSVENSDFHYISLEPQQIAAK
ncbi:unnamed protein product [Brassicogethes aeneus]|uniref:Uncharacterized protein n=1 Tax=Brassicogethes aeneus TaxID=1431903 RepID=A0A9P0B1C6_BRAAE|nr:unnamed protein product [Brassicogethes aeneus]